MTKSKDDKEQSEKKSILSKINKNEKKEKKLPISAKAMIDNMVFSKTDVYAYYRVSDDVYDYLSHNQKVSLGLRTTSSLNNLMANRQESLEGEIIQTSVPFDVDAWAQQMVSVSQQWETGPMYEEFLQEQIDNLDEQEYMKKVTYLGIHLGKRGAINRGDLNFFEVGAKGAFETLKEWLSAAAQVPTESVSAAEEKAFRRTEKDFYTLLSTGNLAAVRATTEELLLLIKRQFHPFPMPVPYLNVDPDNRVGPGDLELETLSVIEKKWRWLKITQMVNNTELTGYRATLSFAKFPNGMSYPEFPPFFYFPAKLSLQIPFTLYARFTLHPASKIRKTVENKRKEQMDELTNIQEGMSATRSALSGLPEDFVDAAQTVNEASAIIASDKTAWIEASYRICVEARTEEILKEICALLQQAYEDLGITLLWTSGDQMTFFLEQMPGDYHRMKAFKQTTTLSMLGTSGFNFSSDIGDPTFGDPTSAQ